ncbi:MAG: F0F1 ATP synthase subunit epsilon [Firmicutes bacterium]|nr:F0F1 ATP synthase subunit epsilon [Bacillota bacterium]
MITNKTLRLDIVTPDRIEFSDEVNMVVAPGIEGDLGILPGHIPLVTRLQTGVLRIYKGSEKLVMAISEGFMEVTKDKVVVLAEAAELPEEVDVERALAAQRRAKERLAAHSHDVDIVRAQAALRRAMTRLQVAREGGRQSSVDLSALDIER